MSTPIVIKYPLDPTGVNPANLVEGEIQAMAARPVRAVATDYGAFFSASLVVTDTVTNLPLLPSQYYAGELYQIPTYMFGQEVCAIIVITDPTVSSTVSLQYQAVGGEFSTSTDAIINMLNNVQLDDRPITWPNIEQKPTDFPPSAHLHDLDDLYGFEYVTFALERIRQAILQGDDVSHDQIYAYIDNNIASLSASQTAALNAAMAAHLATANPHPQYALLSNTDLYPLVRTPINLSPSANAANVVPVVTFMAGPYYSLYGVPQAAAEFRASLHAGCIAPFFFDTTLGAVSSYAYQGMLTSQTAYYWQVRYQDQEGIWSAWSAPTLFTTELVQVNAPTIGTLTNGELNVSQTPTITLSAFSTSGLADTQVSTTWQIWSNNQANGTAVWQLVSTSGNLNSVNVPGGVLAIDQQYFVRAMQTGAQLGPSAWSAWVQFTTGSQGINAPTITSPANNATNVLSSPTLVGTAFSSYGGTDTQKSASWEVWTIGTPVTTTQTFTTSGVFTIPSEVETLSSVVGHGAPATAIPGQTTTTGTNTWQVNNPAIALGAGYVSTPLMSVSGVTTADSQAIQQAPSIAFSYVSLYSFTTSSAGITGNVPNGTYSLITTDPQNVALSEPTVTATVLNNVVTSTNVTFGGLASQNATVTATYVANANPLAQITVTLTATVLSGTKAGSVTVSGGVFTANASTSNAPALNLSVSGGGGPGGTFSLTTAVLTQQTTTTGPTTYTAGSPAIAFGETFAGGTGAAAPSSVTYNNLNVNSGQNYNITVPSGGSVTINYISGNTGTMVWSSELDTNNLTQITVPAHTLTNATQYQARVHYTGTGFGSSPWSTWDVFTLGTFGVNTPAILSPANGSTDSTTTLTLTASPFSAFGTSDTEQSASWELWSSPIAANTTVTVSGSLADAATTSINGNTVWLYQYAWTAPAGVFTMTLGGAYAIIANGNQTVTAGVTTFVTNTVNNVTLQIPGTSSTVVVNVTPGVKYLIQATSPDSSNQLQLAPINFTLSYVSPAMPSNKVWSSYNDTVNLTSITVPTSVLVDNMSYQARVKQTGTLLGASSWSAWNQFTIAWPTGPTQIGLSYGGGYYAGNITVGTANYAIVLAPKASGQSSGLVLDTNNANTPAACFSTNDSVADTTGWHTLGTRSTAATYVKALTIGGNSDWQIPSHDVMSVVATNCGPSTTNSNLYKTTGAEVFTNAWYWTSTAVNVVTSTQTYIPATAGSPAVYVPAKAGHASVPANPGTPIYSTTSFTTGYGDTGVTTTLPSNYGVCPAGQTLQSEASITEPAKLTNGQTNPDAGKLSWFWTCAIPVKTITGYSGATPYKPAVPAQAAYTIPAVPAVPAHYTTSSSTAYNAYAVNPYTDAQSQNYTLQSYYVRAVRLVPVNLAINVNTFGFTVAGGQNLDARTLALAAGWNGTDPVVMTVSANIGSASPNPATPALTVSGAFPGGISIIVNSGVYIAGAGGPGTVGATYINGGTALVVSVPLSIENSGTIAGGGGAGGQNSAGVGSGGAGGGAGYTAGAPGAATTGSSGSSAAGTAGSLTIGGTGATGAGKGGNLGQAGAAGTGTAGGTAGIAVSGIAFVNWIAQGTVTGTQQ